MKKNTKALLSGISIFGIASALLVTGASAAGQNTEKIMTNRSNFPVNLAKKDGAGVRSAVRKVKERTQALTETQKVAWRQSRILIKQGKNQEAKKVLLDAGINPLFGFSKNR